MTALLNIVHLRRHALPVHCATGLDREIALRGALGHVGGSRGRPRLTAAWHVGTDGRLACAWSAEAADRAGPLP